MPLTQKSQKNRPGKIIILYDEDERIASAAATTFVQRDVENVFMLSGGKCTERVGRKRETGAEKEWWMQSNKAEIKVVLLQCACMHRLHSKAVVQKCHFQNCTV